MHDNGNPFDPLFTSPDLYGSTGLNFAVVDDEVTPMAAMADRAMTVLPGAVYLRVNYPNFLCHYVPLKIYSSLN